jgi:hypothetical protein
MGRVSGQEFGKGFLMCGFILRKSREGAEKRQYEENE